MSVHKTLKASTGKKACIKYDNSPGKGCFYVDIDPERREFANSRDAEERAAFLLG